MSIPKYQFQHPAFCLCRFSPWGLSWAVSCDVHGVINTRSPHKNSRFSFYHPVEMLGPGVSYDLFIAGAHLLEVIDATKSSPADDPWMRAQPPQMPAAGCQG